MDIMISLISRNGRQEEGHQEGQRPAQEEVHCAE